jgi:hypothetical protein
MWYQIISVHLEYEPVGGQKPYPVSTAVTIEKDGETQEHVVLLDEADLRQLENLLRQEIDKLLNG